MQNTCLPAIPVLHYPVILVPIYSVPHSQYSMVQSSLRADQGVIHPTVVELHRDGEERWEGEDREGSGEGGRVQNYNFAYTR